MTCRDQHEFAARLHDCLDERRDPFADDELCAWLDAHPEQLEHVAAMCAQLAALPTAALPTAALPTTVLPTMATVTTPRRRSLRPAGIAALAAAAALVFAFARSDDAAPPPPGRVLSASLVELRPGAGAAASFTVHEVLCASPTARLETFELRSLPR